jgi:uncharacterized protein YabE (DUF348 family)
MSTPVPSRSSLGKRAIAVLVLLVAAFILFKIFVGIVTAVATVLAVIVAVAALIWAIRVL